MASNAPAEPIRCPVMDLVEEMGTVLAPSPKTCLMALVSELSLSCVLVP